MTATKELIATGFYTGYLPVAPGSWASWAAACLYLLIVQFIPEFSIHVALIGAGLLFIIGIPAAAAMAERSGRKDPGFVVIDEWAGQFATYTLVAPDAINFIAGFALFRLFDITKPWPISKSETLSGGLGIMVDDMVAGAYAGGLLFMGNILLR